MLHRKLISDSSLHILISVIILAVEIGETLTVNNKPITNCKKPHPVIYVPGFAGSLLEANIVEKSKHDFFCLTLNGKTDVWLGLTSFTKLVFKPIGECWIDEMKLIYHPDSHTTSSQPGTNISVLDFGDPSAVDQMFSTHFVTNLIEGLKSSTEHLVENIKEIFHQYLNPQSGSGSDPNDFIKKTEGLLEKIHDRFDPLRYAVKNWLGKINKIENELGSESNIAKRRGINEFIIIKEVEDILKEIKNHLPFLSGFSEFFLRKVKDVENCLFISNVEIGPETYYNSMTRLRDVIQSVKIMLTEINIFLNYFSDGVVVLLKNIKRVEDDLLQITKIIEHVTDFFGIVGKLWNRELDIEKILQGFINAVVNQIKYISDKLNLTQHLRKFVESLLKLIPVIQYFSTISKALIELGLKPNFSIRAAPYDFRKAPNEQQEYFKKLRSLVEETYHMNQDTPVVLLSHSMGGPMTLHFLYNQDVNWKKKFIKSFISLAAPWGGTMKSMKNYAEGDNFDISIFSSETLKQAAVTFPSVAWMMPSGAFWKQDEELVSANRMEYTLSNLEDFFYKYKQPQAWKLYKDVLNYTNHQEPPGVEVHCLYGSNVTNTLEQLRYDESEQANHVYSSDGDGTVNLRSLQGCRKWIRPEEKVYYSEYENVGHLDIMKNSNVINYIKRVVCSEE